MFYKKTVYMINSEELEDRIKDEIIDENIISAELINEGDGNLDLYIKLREGITEKELEKFHEEYPFISSDKITEIINDYSCGETDFWLFLQDYEGIIEKILGVKISTIEKHYREEDVIAYIFER